MYYLLLFQLLISTQIQCGKIKIAEAPFSFNGAQGAPVVGGGGDTTQDANLILRYDPEKPSGPKYLIDNLFGKCFSRISSNYKYELCPFHNITQREQAYRWNAYNGVLGIWKEWLIEGNNFTYMYMVHGDPCNGDIERETKVNLTCGEKNVVVSVDEPAMCKYEVLFKTPYACPRDVFFVYPVLSKKGKEEWRLIEQEHVIGVTTIKGYQKRRKTLLVSEGLSRDKDLERNTGDKPSLPGPKSSAASFQAHLVPGRPITSSGIFSQDINNINKHFGTKQDCEIGYAELLREVEILREQLRNLALKKINFGSMDMKIEDQSALNNANSFTEAVHTEKHETHNVLKKDRNQRRGDMGEDNKPVPDDSGQIKERKKVDHHDILSTVKDPQHLSKIKDNLIRFQRGDDGVLDESSNPMRNLIGRYQYQANVISRLKVHGRLRNAVGKGLK